MKKFLLTLFTLSFVGFLAYVFLPGIIINIYEKRNYKNLNLSVKKIQCEKGKIEYFEGGEGDTILLVHGFQSDKKAWIPYCKHLMKSFHVIALDLPGHGNSSCFDDFHCDIYSFERALDDFIKAKKLEKFHLMGSSMGGGVVSIYAYNNPFKLNSLILLNPLGIDIDKKSELQLLIEQGKNLMFPSSLEEFDQHVQMVCGKKANLSSYFKGYVLRKMKKRYSFFKKAFEELLSSKPLDDILPQIKVDSLIVISGKDRLIHPESFEHFVAKVPKIKAHRIQDASHVFIENHFKEAVLEIMVFLGSDKNRFFNKKENICKNE